MEELENFLKDAIETDTPSEHTVPLNDNGEFVNGVFYEDKVHEAQVKVTVLDHYTDNEEKEKVTDWVIELRCDEHEICLLYTSPSPRDRTRSRMPSSA